MDNYTLTNSEILFLKHLTSTNPSPNYSQNEIKIYKKLLKQYPNFPLFIQYFTNNY